MQTCLCLLQEARQTLDDLKISLDQVTEKMNQVAVFFCQEVKKFKLEELFGDVLSFLRELENAQKVCYYNHILRGYDTFFLFFLQENQQRIVLEEKKRKREAAKKEADEAKRKRGGGKGVAAAPVVEEEGFIIDNLLKEIRAGTNLKSSGRKATLRRKSRNLSNSDMGKLNAMVTRANSRRSTSRSPVITPSKTETSTAFPFPFPESALPQKEEKTTEQSMLPIPESVETPDTRTGGEATPTLPAARETPTEEIERDKADHTPLPAVPPQEVSPTERQDLH